VKARQEEEEIVVQTSRSGIIHLKMFLSTRRIRNFPALFFPVNEMPRGAF
jgi:hypothetical protein